MKLVRGLVLLGVLLSLMVAGPVSTKAADKGIQISPLTFNMDIPVGGAEGGKIIITNHNTTDLSYVIEVENFAAVDDSGAVAFAGKEDSSGVTSLADWFTFDQPKEGIVPPLKDTTVNFKINIPLGADPGGHYAAIFAREIKKSPTGQAEIGIASRVGTLVLVSVPGKVTKSAELFDFTYPKFIWRGPTEFILKAKNTGTVHFDLDSKISLKNMFGSEKIVDLGTHTVIPNSNRIFSGIWQSKNPFGYFQVTPTASTLQGSIATSPTVTIIAIPLMIVIPSIIGLIIICLIIGYIRKHFKFVQDKPKEPTN